MAHFRINRPPKMTLLASSAYASSYISVNWRGKPLTSLETIIELISHTTTKHGLTVQAMVDQNSYPLGIKVSDEDMGSLAITRDAFHGEWNYTIRPQRL